MDDIKYTIASPLFKNYMYFSSLLILKMLFMTLLTIWQRLKKGVRKLKYCVDYRIFMHQYINK
jgi:hypothetical protein